MSNRISIKAVVASLALSSLLGCATRDWVAPANVSSELATREAAVAQQLTTATGPQRHRLHIIEGALIASRRALDAGQVERARQELQVAVDLMDGVR